MSGLCPPPAPSTWKKCIVLPSIAFNVVSTKPLSLRVSVCIKTCTSCLSATVRQLSIVAGVVPQSSWSFNEHAPAIICSSIPRGKEVFPLPAKAKFIENASLDCNILSIWKAPGETVVASVPVEGPVPPPNIVVIPECNDSSICWGQIKWIWLSKPPAVIIFPSPAIISVPGPIIILTAGWTSGLPALPILLIKPSLIPISAL